MSRPLRRSVAVVGTMLIALPLVAQQLGLIGKIVLPGCGVTTILCWMFCTVIPASTVGLVVWLTWRAIRSVRDQRTRTRQALQPLLSLPSAAPPRHLAVLLRNLRLDGLTRVITLDTPVALCYDLLRPRLLLSTGVLRGLSDRELATVLHHERAHLQRRDPLRLVIVRALAHAMPCLPVLSQFAAMLPVLQELAADRVALAASDTDALAGALLKVGEALGPLRSTGMAIGAFSALDARIDQLLGAPPPRSPLSPKVALSIVVVLLLSPLCCLSAPLLWRVVLRPPTRGKALRHSPV